MYVLHLGVVKMELCALDMGLQLPFEYIHIGWTFPNFLARGSWSSAQPQVKSCTACRVDTGHVLLTCLNPWESRQHDMRRTLHRSASRLPKLLVAAQLRRSERWVNAGVNARLTQLHSALESRACIRGATVRSGLLIVQFHLFA